MWLTLENDEGEQILEYYIPESPDMDCGLTTEEIEWEIENSHVLAGNLYQDVEDYKEQLKDFLESRPFGLIFSTTKQAKLMLVAYQQDEAVRELVDNSPEFYRALVYETGVVEDPAALDGTEEYEMIINSLEHLSQKYGKDKDYREIDPNKE